MNNDPKKPNRYALFLKKWSREKGISPFFGSDKDEFLNDWYEAKLKNEPKPKKETETEKEKAIKAKNLIYEAEKIKSQYEGRILGKDLSKSVTGRRSKKGLEYNLNMSELTSEYNNLKKQLSELGVNIEPLKSQNQIQKELNKRPTKKELEEEKKREQERELKPKNEPFNPVFKKKSIEL